MSAIKFVLNVRDSAVPSHDSYTNKRFYQDREVTVIAVSDVDAKDTYYRKVPRYDVEVLSIKSVEVAKFPDLDTSGKFWSTADYFVSDAVENLAFIEEMEPFPADCNPFHHDCYSMGTSLVRRWMIMHDGYDNEKNPYPLNHLYFVNTATGRRVCIHLNDKLPAKVEA